MSFVPEKCIWKQRAVVGTLTGRERAVMFRQLSGLGHALLGSLTISASAAVVKGTRVQIGQALFLTSLVAFVTCLPLVLYRRHNLLPRGRRWQLFAVSCLGNLMMILEYQAARLMPIGDETVITFTGIIFTILFARIFLGEACTWQKWVCSFFIILGVVMISSPSGASSAYPYYALGCVLTIISAVCDASDYIFIKELTDTPYSVIFLCCGIASMIITAPLCLVEDWTKLEQPISLITISFLTLVHDISIILALSSEEAALVSFVQASDIVFAYIWELAFFEEPYSVLRIMGAVIVVSAVSIAALLDKGPSVRIFACVELPLFLRTTELKCRSEISIRAEQILKWLRLRKG